MWLILLAATLVFAAGDSANVTEARAKLDLARRQVAEGLLPVSSVTEAQAAVDDALDQQVLDHTLYAHLGIEDFTEQQAAEMLGAAERRVERVQEKVDRGNKLIEAGIAERHRFADIEQELVNRTQTLDQAKSRAGLLIEMAAVVHAEADSPEAPLSIGLKAEEHVEGDHLLEAEDVRGLKLAFEKQFREPLPVSANGQTAVHRAMGFDHTGRIDVALTPDSTEGTWLRKYLETREIPYYAFRVAIPGKATAPHIHIGPGSARIHSGD